MKNKMKVPKNGNSKILSNDVEATLIGVMLLLVSLIGLLGKGPVGQFLQYCIVFIFGNFYFLVYAYLIFISLYFIIAKKMYTVKINMYLFASILILFSLLIGASSTNIDLTISNFSNTYINILNATPGISLFKITSFEAISYTGGGYLGFLLRGFLNTCFTSVGTTIVVAVFAFVGISVFLKDFIVYFIRFFKAVKTKTEERRSKKLEEHKSEEETKTKVNGVSFVSDDEPIVTEPEIKTFKPEYKEERSTQVVKEEPTPFVVKEEKLAPFIVKEEPAKPLFVEESRHGEENSFTPENKMQLFVDDIPNEEEKKSESVGVKSETIPVEPVKKTYEEVNNQILEPIVSKPINNIKEEPIINNSSFVNEEVAPTQSNVSNNELEHEEKRPLYENYQLPPLSILKDPQNDDVSLENRIIAEQRLNKINELFQQFKIGATAISYTIGPSCTRFNIKMNPGVKVNVLSSIQNEIAIYLGGNKTVRLELVVEGRDTSSIEIGNVKISSVSFKECLKSISNRTSPKDKLLVPLGKGIEGNVITVSLDELPHLLVAGTTGSGKSVLINTMIASLIMRNRPDELKLMLIDPKKIEFSKYNDLPHLLCPVISEAVEGKNALKKLVAEMENRYSLFLTKGKGCSKISEFNELAEVLGLEKLPNIVMICDEFSDFMSEYGKEIEPLIKRLAQKARACGIYLIICTQRPSATVITGDIKAVVPSRISLSVSQALESRIILDEGGAESLLGNGDMLARIPRHNSLLRVQGSFVTNLELISVCDFIRSQAKADYNQDFVNLVEQDDLGGVNQFEGGFGTRKQKDVLHEQAKRHVVESRIASTSNLQSFFGIGYARADHILNCLEDEGVIKRASNGNRRIVVMTMEDYERQQQEKANNE